jgi:hypothetical protein
MWYFTSPEPWTSVALSDGVGEHVQPAPVRHADHDLRHVRVRRVVQDRVQDRDQALGALERVAAVAHVLLVEEALEGLRLVELREDPASILIRERLWHALHAVLDPALLLRLGDVHVLHARGAAVGVAEHVQDLGELEAALAGQAAGHELPV